MQGEVRVDGGGQRIDQLGPIVVYLDGGHTEEAPEAGTLTLSDDRSDPFGHDLVVLPRGQSLRFASRSGVAHRLFALRGEERLDVRVSESGESPPVPMDRAGWVRFYCSLHQDENWDVFVSPSPHFARLGRDGRYRIDGVPLGDYEISLWSEKVEGPVRDVRVGFLTSTLVSIWLDPAQIRP